MAYSVKSKKSGTEYYLHGRGCGQRQDQTVFLRQRATKGREVALNELPEGYEVSENSATGLPILKKKK